MARTKAQLIEAVEIAEELKRRARMGLRDTYFPDEGPLRRELYAKHCDFFKGGEKFRERCMISANRVGKTAMGAYEVSYHLTGNYPEWWTGRRFNRPTSGWCAGDTSKTVRDIIQYKLLGKVGDYGTGMIPGSYIVKTTPKHGLPDAVDTVYVKHFTDGVEDGVSECGLKSYDQRREAFQGTEKDYIWMDEEPPEAIFTECLLRTMTTNGLILCTFTPLMGVSDVVMSFMPHLGHEGVIGEGVEVTPNKLLVMATWDDCPHLSKSEKEAMWSSIPAYQREARSKGIPSLGSGAVWKFSEERIKCEPFEIPEYWPKAYALDVGWNNTAALWGAWDRSCDTVYVWNEYKQAEAEPATHVQSIKARGDWIPGVIDPAARGRAQRDGVVLLDEYVGMGLDLDLADNSVETGLFKVEQRFAKGTLKVFSTCRGFFEENRLYSRDDKGKVKKVNDHLCDCLRYLIMSGMARAVHELEALDSYEPREHRGQNATTGY